MKSVDDQAVVQRLQTWFREQGELYVNVYQPHGGSSGDRYLVSSYEDFRALVNGSKVGVVFLIPRELQFPLRGVVDDEFISRAVQFIQNGEDFGIVDETPAPERLWSYGSGDTHTELIEQLEECRGTFVCVGKDVDFPLGYWLDVEYPDLLIVER